MGWESGFISLNTPGVASAQDKGRHRGSFRGRARLRLGGRGACRRHKNCWTGTTCSWVLRVQEQKIVQASHLNLVLWFPFITHRKHNIRPYRQQVPCATTVNRCACAELGLRMQLRRRYLGTWPSPAGRCHFRRTILMQIFLWEYVLYIHISSNFAQNLKM